MQRYQNLCEERLVFRFERQGKPIDNGSQYLKQFRYPIMTLRFIDKVEEDVIDRPPDETTKGEEFSVDPMKGGLEEIALAWIFRVKQLKEVEYKRLVDVSPGEVGIKVRTFDEAEEEFVDNLKMWPGEFEDGFVFFGVKGITCRVNRRGYRTEQVGSKL